MFVWTPGVAGLCDICLSGFSLYWKFLLRYSERSRNSRTAVVRFPARVGFFYTLKLPDRLWGPPSLLSSGCFHLAPRPKMMDLYLRSPIRLHGVVINLLNTYIVLKKPEPYHCLFSYRTIYFKYAWSQVITSNQKSAYSKHEDGLLQKWRKRLFTYKIKWPAEFSKYTRAWIFLTRRQHISRSVHKPAC
jgi:hypothetical protein